MISPRNALFAVLFCLLAIPAFENMKMPALRGNGRMPDHVNSWDRIAPSAKQMSVSLSRSATASSVTKVGSVATYWLMLYPDDIEYVNTNQRSTKGPEPGTLLLLGTGLFGVAAVILRQLA
jgi:hypothetical protein